MGVVLAYSSSGQKAAEAPIQFRGVDQVHRSNAGSPRITAADWFFKDYST